MDAFLFSPHERRVLLSIARQQLLAITGLPIVERVDEQMLPDALRQKYGAFISLYLEGKLRGCIGSFKGSRPLFETVKEMTHSAAFFDSRFDPVKKAEVDAITIEISVLSPMRKIGHIGEIELGKHGIYISDGYRSGTFLPQVAHKTGWSLEEFLGHCSRDKAGLGWNGWRNADVYTYEAIVFSE
jgi:MEMO1 family protein